MKKIFTLLAMALMAIGAQAQTTYDFSGLTAADFTVNSAGSKGTYTMDEQKGPSVNYTSTTGENMVVTVKGVTFEYKNGSSSKDGHKDNVIKTSPDFIQLDSKNFYIKLDNLNIGDVITIYCSSKSDDESKATIFGTLEGCTADSENPEKVIKAANLESYTACKFHATETSVAIRETNNGVRISKIVVEAGSVAPVEPHAAQAWDFTSISDADITNLEADTENWEKSTQGEAPNDYIRYSNKFVVAKVADGNNKTNLEANGQALALADGLAFGRYNNKINADNIRIDINKRIVLNGSDVLLYVDDCKAGDKIKIRFSTASSNSEERGFNVDNATPTNAMTVDKTEVEFTVSENGSVIFKTTAGVNLYAVAVNTDLPEEIADGISVLKAETVEGNGVIYNLQGQRVDANYRGVVIKNGHKVVIK